MSEDFYMIQCPHCDGTIVVAKNEINCAIFRHGSFKKNNQPIHPHLPKPMCDRLFQSGLIYGCGKPFKVYFQGDKLVAEICDYI